MTNLGKFITALVVCLVVAGSFYFWQSSSPTIKNVDNKTIVADLAGRSVVIPPFNQTWFFDTNQNLGVKVLQRKVDGDVAVFMVEIGAIAIVPKSEQVEQSKEQTSQPLVPSPIKPPTPSVSQQNQPNKAVLAGSAKLTYEKVGSEWFLINIDPITLRIVFE